MVKKKSYVPNRGDIIWIDFRPTRGHEQSGWRPALVLTHRRYNQQTKLAIVCPLTLESKGYLAEVPVMVNNKMAVVLSNQIRNVDWQHRGVKFIAKADHIVLFKVQENIRVLLHED